MNPFTLSHKQHATPQQVYSQQQLQGYPPPQQVYSPQPQLGYPQQQQGFPPEYDPQQQPLIPPAGNLTGATEQELFNQAFGPERDRINAYIKDIQDRLGNVGFSFQSDLFDWTRWMCGDFFLGSDYSWCAVPCVMVVMMVLYSFGLALLLLHLQYMNMCEQGLVKAVEPCGAGKLCPTPTPSCGGLAQQCLVTGTTLNFEGYIQYRIAAYILVLVPLLYIPFMVILYMSSAIKTITGLLLNVQQDDWQTKFNSTREQSLQEKAQRQGSKDRGMKEFGSALGNLAARMDKDGHSSVMNLMVLVFHGLMGGASMFLDASLYASVKDGATPECQKYQDTINEMKLTPLSMDLEFLSLWELLVGSFFAVVTILYLMSECWRRVFAKDDAHNARNLADFTHKRDKHQRRAQFNAQLNGVLVGVDQQINDLRSNYARENQQRQLLQAQQGQQQGGYYNDD